MILNDLFSEWLEVYSKRQSKHEIKNKKNRYLNHIKSVLGEKNIKDINFKDCQKLTNDLIFDKELHPKTAKNIIMILSALFNYAIKNDYLEKNPVKYVDFGDISSKVDLTISHKQTQDLISNIMTFSPAVHRDIFILALHGRRKEEILSLQWFQVDFDNRIYFITAEKSKNRKKQNFAMTDLLFSMFHQRKTFLKKFGLVKKDDYVFINQRTLARYTDISKPFFKLKKQSKIKNFRFHDFRHLLATEAINKGATVEHISQTLGHSNIEITQKYITNNNLIPKMICDVFLSDFLKNSESI